jgi:hypothetical protein
MQPARRYRKLKNAGDVSLSSASRIFLAPLLGQPNPADATGKLKK